MGDLARLMHRQPAWKPTRDSVPVAEYQYHEMPLVGVFRQDGREFLFMCVDGQDEVLSLWWYVAIESEQRAAIESASPEYDDLVGTMQLHGWSRLAFATTRLGIVDFEDVKDSEEGAEAALHALQARLDELHDDAHGLELVAH